MELALPLWFEIGTYVVLLLILAADVTHAYLRPHVPSTRESTLWFVFYVSLAMIFAGLMFAIGSPEYGGQFIAGFLTEKSLSVDNLFVFIIIMARFSVPRKYQQEILMVGIIMALVFRGIFILLGAQLIANFSWIFYIFGAFLIWTAIRQAMMSHDEEEQKESAIIAFLRKRIPITDEYDGGKLRIKRNGAMLFTPVIVVFIALGTTDLVFAIDSIPAIFGITQSPFIVFTANVFALMGLRQLYFLLGDLVDRLAYLKHGIVFILGFIGVKLLLHALHENEVPFINNGEHVDWLPEIDTWTSLIVIVAAMTIAVVASLIKLRREGREVVVDTTTDVSVEPERSEGAPPSAPKRGAKE